MARLVAATAVILLGSAATYAFAGAAVSDPAMPGWEPEAGVLGTISFFDASGAPVTGGDLGGHPVALYAEASGPGRAGDTKAQLKIFTPQVNVLPVLWSGDTLSGATAYPNPAAPPTIKALTNPVATGTAGDLSMADYIDELPNTSTQPGYQNLYELRLYTSGPGQTQNVAYFRVDIEVTGTTTGSWSVVFPDPTATPSPSASPSPSGPVTSPTPTDTATTPTSTVTVTTTVTSTPASTPTITPPPDTAVDNPPPPASEPTSAPPTSSSPTTAAPSNSAGSEPAAAPTATGQIGGELTLASDATSVATFTGLALMLAIASIGGVAAAVTGARRRRSSHLHGRF